MDVLLENFRCFSGGRHRIPLRPLTVLVGENSTGKSSFIASLAALADASRFPLSPGFNIPPFELGSYETIATRRVTGKSANSFKIGFQEYAKGRGTRTRLLATYADTGGRAQFSHLELETEVGRINAKFIRDDILEIDVEIPLAVGHRTKRMRVHAEARMPSVPSTDLRGLLGMQIVPLVMDELQEQAAEGKQATRGDWEPVLHGFYKLINRMVPSEWQALAVAPIRSKPQRTYDTFADDFDPEGGHVPLRLARMFEKPRRKQVQRLRQMLKAFGRESGLFGDVQVRRFSGKSGSAFQVHVKLGQRDVNLMDVGYGVSQSLPVIVQSVLSSPKRTILLQQPEVHLHPRAQAALGSLFLDLVTKEEKNFVVETHSDYLIDRVRRLVPARRLDPKLVALLYFERTGAYCRVHTLELDEDGNILKAPRGYRRFFLEEEMELLSRKRGK